MEKTMLICNIQTLQNIIQGSCSCKEDLKKLTLNDLRDIQDELIKKYEKRNKANNTIF